MPMRSSTWTSIFSVDPISGALTQRATVAAGSLPTAVAIDTTGRFTYVANRGYRQMSMYSIAANGMLMRLFSGGELRRA
jgi:hypothetical protein